MTRGSAVPLMRMTNKIKAKTAQRTTKKNNQIGLINVNVGRVNDG